MTQLEQAARQALEALEVCEQHGYIPMRLTRESITAIKEALSGCQCPECQVVLHASDCAVHNEPAYPKGQCNCGAQPEQEPVKPAQQVVDSDEKAGAYMEARLWEFIDMAAAWPKASPDPRTWDHVMVYAPKPPQRTEPEQEPVAWLDEYGNTFPLAAKQYSVVGKHWKPLYTTPPQRKPLTDEEILTVARDHYNLYQRPEISFSRAIEAAHGIKENT